MVSRGSLKSGGTISCGCYHKEQLSKLNKKHNVFEIYDTYCIGYTTNTNKMFLIDVDDYDKVCGYTWLENDQGYIIASKPITNQRLHRFVMNMNDDRIIDHINRKRNDNRKSNLRISNKQLNGINRTHNKNNKLGVKGVSKYNNKFFARICKDGKEIYLGLFDNIEDAKRVRNNAEKELFKELYEGGDSNK